MLINFVANFLGLGLVGGSAGAFEQGALVYLSASVLAPLSWMFIVELCRRAQASAQEKQPPLELRPAVSRLTFTIANLKKHGPSSWWMEDHPQGSEGARG
jgi:hypothetical protein